MTMPKWPKQASENGAPLLLVSDADFFSTYHRAKADVQDYCNAGLSLTLEAEESIYDADEGNQLFPIFTGDKSCALADEDDPEDEPREALEYDDGVSEHSSAGSFRSSKSYKVYLTWRGGSGKESSAVPTGHTDDEDFNEQVPAIKTEAKPLAEKTPWVMGPHKVPLKPDSESDLAWKARILANREAAKMKTEPMAKIQAKPTKARPPMKAEIKEEASEGKLLMLYDSTDFAGAVNYGSLCSAVVDPGATATILTTALAEALYAKGHLKDVEFSPKEFGTANSTPLKTMTKATLTYKGLQQSTVFVAEPSAGLKTSLLGIPALRNLVLVMSESNPTLSGQPLSRAPNGHFLFEFGMADDMNEVNTLQSSESMSSDMSSSLPHSIQQAALRLGLH